MTEKTELSISAALRRGREARGESLEQVQQRLGVSLIILQGIESEQYDVVEPIYARLAIWHYAEHLGLGGDAMTARFEREIGLSEAPVAMNTDRSTPVPVTPSSPLVGFLQRQPLSRVLGAAVVILILVIVGMVLAQRGDTDAQSFEQSDDYLSSPLASRTQNSNQADGESSAVTATSSPAPVSDRTPAAVQTPDQTPEQVPAQTGGASASLAAAGSQQTQTASPNLTPTVTEPTGTVPSQDSEATIPEATDTVRSAIAASDGAQRPENEVPFPTSATDGTARGIVPGAIELEARALDSTWVQVQWDGVDGIEEIIPKGETRRWHASQFFMVRAGRAHGLHFRLQGALLGEGQLGDATKVLRFRGLTNGYQMLGPELEPLGSFTQLPSPEATAESVVTELP
jgi:cytoskeletal protein RodZ